MIFIPITCILSILCSLAIYIPTGLYTKGWYFIFVFLISLPITYILIVALFILLVCIYSLFINPNKELKKRSKFAYFIARQISLQVMFLLKVRPHIKNKELMPKNTNYLLISNHLSGFDPMFSIVLSKNQPLICITKFENLKIPVFGKIMYKAGFISIDRDNDFEAIKSISKASKILKNKEASILIYPEGTRSKTGQLQEFHAGSFKIATKAKAPIVVMNIKNITNIKKNMWFKGTDVYFNVLKYITPEEYKDMNTTELATLCHDLMLEDK